MWPREQTLHENDEHDALDVTGALQHESRGERKVRKEDASATMRYAWQRDSVTFFVIFIVMSSFSYLAIVMANEITGYTPKWLLKCFRPRQSALLSAANTIQNQKDDQIEMSVLNPTMVQGYVLAHSCGIAM